MVRKRSSGMKFGVPLATPASKRVLYCYASHGKGFGHEPPVGVPLRMLVTDACGSTRWEAGRYLGHHLYACEALAGQPQWRRLGWIMEDGSKPLGEYDAVDPFLAQFNYLPAPHITECRLHSTV